MDSIRLRNKNHARDVSTMVYLDRYLEDPAFYNTLASMYTDSVYLCIYMHTYHSTTHTIYNLTLRQTKYPHAQSSIAEETRSFVETATSVRRAHSKFAVRCSGVQVYI